jgi:hypothetical protein
MFLLEKTKKYFEDTSSLSLVYGIKFPSIGEEYDILLGPFSLLLSLYGLGRSIELYNESRSEKLSTLEYIGKFMQTAPIISLPAYITSRDPSYSFLFPILSLLVGCKIEKIGKSIRKRRKR